MNLVTILLPAGIVAVPPSSLALKIWSHPILHSRLKASVGLARILLLGNLKGFLNDITLHCLDTCVLNDVKEMCLK